MKLVEASIKYPIAVSVGVILLVMFGLLAFMAVPVQLTPDVDRPEITVETTWRGASPHEIEREIVMRQEKELKSVEGLTRMTSESMSSRGRVLLEFEVGTDIPEALLRVNNKLQQVPRYPANADKPILFSASQDAQPIAWMVIKAISENAPPIPQARTFIKERVVPLLERVAGISSANLYGGRDEEMQVEVDPDAVAAHKLTMRQIAAQLQAENNDYSGGGLNEGKRRYEVRAQSRFIRPEDVDDVVLAYEDGAPVFVKDVGRTIWDYATPTSVVMHFGEPTMAMNAIREAGTNVLKVMARFKESIAEINENVLKEMGLAIKQVYDETEYIVQAIDLVRNNIFLGGSLAVVVLLLFLRSITSTLIIAMAIPISLIGTFMMMSLFGRNLNVISLAGLAFASGMVLDAAIVVLENIYRRFQGGETRMDAAYKGTVQVWGAIFASTTTTVAVFLPVIRIKEEAGQLFADIAIAVSFAVIISLAVSISVIPSLASRIVGAGGVAGQALRKGLGPLAFAGGGVGRFVVAAVSWLTGSVSARLAVVVVLTGLSVSMAVFLAPKAEYLPTGDQNFILGIALPPPGYNIEKYREIGEGLTERLNGHWGPDIYSPEGAKKKPAIEEFFFVGYGNMNFMGLSAWDDREARSLIPLMQRELAMIPGVIPIVQQTSLFGQGFGEGRNIDLDITGPDLSRLVGLGFQLFGQIRELLPGSQIRPIPGLELAQPEIRFMPDRVRAAAVGLTASDIGFNLDVLVEGAKVDEVTRSGYQIDLQLVANPDSLIYTQDLGRLELNTPQGKLVTLDSVAPPQLVGGPTQINHIERQRALTLRIYPPDDIALQDAMDRLNQQILSPLKESGQVAPPFNLTLSGTADDLTRTYEALKGNFMLALAITFLLMAALFGSYVYPFVIMFSVPLAAAGGFLGLWVVNHTLAYQPLDVLTMLGFVILIGIVVNNAILIVDQSLRGIRDDGLNISESVTQAVQLRVRPIFMTTFTSVFGMLPMVVIPGAGSELYRGLGSVVLGGLLVSTVFTLFLVPSLLSLVLDARRKLAEMRGKPFMP